MNNKKSVIITAIVTFIATSALFIGGYSVYNSPMLSQLGIGIKGKYSADMVKRAGKMIEEVYYEDVNTDRMYEAALHGMMESLGDRYSWFVNEEDYAALMADMGGEYTGIGVHVTIDTEDNLLTVVAPIEDTPAYKAGLKSGDKFISVNGNAVSGDNYQAAINMMRGSSKNVGEEIRLVIKRAETNAEEEITLIREKIILKTVKSKILPGGVVYLRITSFDENTTTEFKEHLTRLKNETEIKGIVLDLRNNGGGLFRPTVEIASAFLPEGLLTYFEYHDGTKEEFFTNGKSIDLPFAVLINGSSASASEVLAGAVRDYKSGTLVGEKSFGKGIVQTILPLMTTSKGKTALYLTTSKYFTPNGECIHGTGITPDIEIAMPEEYKDANFDDLTMDQDVQLKAAWSEVARQIQ